jgi:hypothetical protein
LVGGGGGGRASQQAENVVPFQVLESVESARAAVEAVAKQADAQWKALSAQAPSSSSSFEEALSTSFALHRSAAAAHRLHVTGGWRRQKSGDKKGGERVFGLNEVGTRWAAVCESSGGLVFQAGLDGEGAHSRKTALVLVATLALAGLAVSSVGALLKRKTAERRRYERLIGGMLKK